MSPDPHENPPPDQQPDQPREPRPAQTRRGTRLVAAALAAVTLLIGGASVVNAIADGSGGAAQAQGKLFDGQHILFRSLKPGGQYSRLGYTDLAGDQETRHTVKTRCLRVAAGADGAVCLRQSSNPAQPFEVAQLDHRLRPVDDEALNGTPSRARVAPDGQHFATTTFVSGHSYISLGFSTETILYRGDGRRVGNLENFTFLINGNKDHSADRNVWGVTFADDSNRFFATVAASGRTYLAQGDVAERTLVAIQHNAECPSLSPDGDTIVYKKRVDLSLENAWRFHAFDLETGKETPLGETRSVDDQVAWLDDEHVMYAVPKTGKGPRSADIWVAPLDGGKPRLLIEDADSPTVAGR